MDCTIERGERSFCTWHENEVTGMLLSALNNVESLNTLCKPEDKNKLVLSMIMDSSVDTKNKTAPVRMRLDPSSSSTKSQEQPVNYCYVNATWFTDGNLNGYFDIGKLLATAEEFDSEDHADSVI